MFNFYSGLNPHLLTAVQTPVQSPERRRYCESSGKTQTEKSNMDHSGVAPQHTQTNLKNYWANKNNRLNLKKRFSGSLDLFQAKTAHCVWSQRTWWCSCLSGGGIYIHRKAPLIKCGWKFPFSCSRTLQELKMSLLKLSSFLQNWARNRK